MAVDAAGIPRYAEPTDPPAPARTCGGCAHACELGKVLACCFERDKVGTLGELYEVMPDDEAWACDDWEEAEQ